MASTASTIVLKVAYGYTVQEGKDPFVELAEKTMSMVSRLATPGAFLVDLIPACKIEFGYHYRECTCAQVVYSTISPGMVPWYGILAGCKEIQSACVGVDSEASPIRRGANGVILFYCLLC